MYIYTFTYRDFYTFTYRDFYFYLESSLEILHLGGKSPILTCGIRVPPFNPPLTCTVHMLLIPRSPPPDCGLTSPPPLPHSDSILP